jgi:hypothetical protein
MLYLIHGDPNIIFEKAQKTSGALLKKKPDASIFKINQDNFSESKMEELLGGQGLFVQKYIVLMSRLLEDVNSKEYTLDHLEELKESDNIFIWTEEKVEKKDLNRITRQAEKVEEYEVKEKKTERIDVFKITDLLGRKDKKNLWLEYRNLIQQGIPVEEIYGVLWWQVKSMLIAAKTNTAKDAGMKDYPYKKAKGYLNNFKDGELNDFASNLVQTYHQSRLDGEDLELNLEKLLLKY